MTPARHGGWRLPLALALAGFLMVVAWTGLRFEDQPTSTSTPTKTPVPALETTARAAMAVEPADLPTATPIESRPPVETPTLAPTAVPSCTPSPTSTSSGTAAAPGSTVSTTPAPTFTPPQPNPPAGSEWDHYWLERPIPPDYTNWTDRIYPYGSTQGGTLPIHHGVEFYNPAGVPVLAAGAGTVVTAGSDSQVQFGLRKDYYGNLVIIRHERLYRGQYLYTLYGHLSEVLVTEGQTVAAGDLVGSVGGTGVAQGGAHLHFEVRVGENNYGATRNPELWIRPFPGWGTIAGRLEWPDGGYVYEAPLLIRRPDDPSRFVDRTIYTYADDSVNPDDGWRENFTSPDLEPGPYEVIFRHEDIFRQELVWVYPGQTAFVTIQLGVAGE